MASKQITEVTDDLDPTGQTPADETVTFGLDGVTYEIDLTDANARAFRDLFSGYIQVARVLPRSGSAKTRTSNQRLRSQHIRNWALSAGLEVSERGRMPASIVRQWEAAGKPAA